MNSSAGPGSKGSKNVNRSKTGNLQQVEQRRKSQDLGKTKSEIINFAELTRGNPLFFENLSPTGQMLYLMMISSGLHNMRPVVPSSPPKITPQQNTNKVVNPEIGAIQDATQNYSIATRSVTHCNLPGNSVNLQSVTKGVIESMNTILEPLVKEGIVPSDPMSQKTQQWHQKTVQANKGNQEVRKIMATRSTPPKAVPVIVMETGFNPEILNHLVVNPASVTFNRLVPRPAPWRLFNSQFDFGVQREDLPPDLPESVMDGDHATTTLSVLAHKNFGIVKQGIDLHLYRSPYGGALFGKSVEEACANHPNPEGLTIINLSLGTFLDEANEEVGVLPSFDGTQFVALRDETRFPESIMNLTEMGCWVAKAAGNSGYNGPHVNSLKDPWTRVGSIDRKNQVAAASSVAEIHAPGVQVWTQVISAPGVEDHPGLVKIPCGPNFKEKCAYRSGTSFATPVAAGIASQVVYVLQNSLPTRSDGTAAGPSYFAQLKNQQRLELLNAILFHSQKNHSVNLYRAIKLAEKWNDLSIQEGKPIDPSRIETLAQNSET